MNIVTSTSASKNEQANRGNLHSLYRNSPIHQDEILTNLPLYTKRQDFTRQLFFYEVYKMIISIHGDVFELGCRWGANLNTLMSLRGILEPFNLTRRIVGFDSFQGFPNVDKKDGDADYVKKGSYGVTENYEAHLEKVLSCQSNESPLGHIKRHELIKGDATKTVPQYLIQNPQTTIAFAYFDFDIYEPTKECLEAILPYLTTGSIIGFDEANDPQWPGETIAIREVFGNRHSLKRFPFTGKQSYMIFNP